MLSDSYPRGGGVASIPSRRSLDVQLGPAAAGVAEDDSRPQHQHSMGRGYATSPEPPPETQRRHQQRHQQLHQHPPQRVRWSRMAPTAAAAPERSLAPVPPLTLAASTAGLCQLVDFGETRELIRRQREASKKLQEVSSIVSHLSLDKENSDDPHPDCTGWSTFRPQPNSQFKQYVFQSPSKAHPNLPTAEADGTAPTAPQQQQRQQRQLQRSQTTLGLMAGRAVARHRRPEPLGAALSREQTSISGAGGVSLLPHRRQQQQQQQQAHYNAQGRSSSFFLTSSDWAYGQFEHRRSKSYRLD